MFEQSVLPVIGQAAEVRYVFDEERALKECRELIERRDEAKGEFKSVMLELGRRLLDARRAYPDVYNSAGCGRKLSPRFADFVQRIGLGLPTAKTYMSYARDPRRVEWERTRKAKHSSAVKRNQVLREMLTAYDQGATADEIFTAIREELKAHEKTA